MRTRVLAPALAASLWAPAAAGAKTETASSGSVTATLTSTAHDDGPPYAEDQRLVSEDAGPVIVGQRIPDDRFLTEGGELVDVTRSAAVREQAERSGARHRKARRRMDVDRGDHEVVRSSLAARAPTPCLLDRCLAAQERLARAAELGVVRPGFPRAVRRFVERLGSWS